MARRWRGRRRGRGQMTFPIAPIMGFVPMIAPSVEAAMRGDTNGALNLLAWNSIGWDWNRKTWDGAKMVQNVTPLIAGLLIHKFVGGSPLNLNRTLARARVPFIRI